ncbi:uncharacterized protein [Montipora capricornis]|uniref:uncharacterized protein n=1 Tax=Montipora capricornis TaxID=246305 RepID=UPI0035F13C92
MKRSAKPSGSTPGKLVEKLNRCPAIDPKSRKSLFSFKPEKLSSPSNSSNSSRTISPIPVVASTSCAQAVEEGVQVKTKKARSKSVDWMDDETHDLLEAWGPRYSQLRSASQREKVSIWNQIYASYKSAYPQSQRTLQQIKKRQQNLEYEYKLLKQKSQKTGEAGIKQIKDGFPYFDYFDDVMGHRDSVDSSKMAVEGSSIFTTESEEAASESGSVSAPTESAHPDKRKVDKPENSVRKGKRRRQDEPGTSGQSSNFQRAFMEMWERSMNEDRQRFERSAEIFCEAQTKQMEQTNAILSGFKDIFKDLASK